MNLMLVRLSVFYSCIVRSDTERTTAMSVLYLILSNLILSYLILSDLILSYLILSTDLILAKPRLAYFCFILSYIILSYLNLLILSCLFLFYFTLYFYVLFCFVLFYLIKHYFILRFYSMQHNVTSNSIPSFVQFSSTEFNIIFPCSNHISDYHMKLKSIFTKTDYFLRVFQPPISLNNPYLTSYQPSKVLPVSLHRAPIKIELKTKPKCEQNVQCYKHLRQTAEETTII